MNNEAFSRVLIDDLLKASGWDLSKPKEVRMELSGTNGRADYVLMGSQGALCVLEAKREDLDPYDAKDQARGYAENLNAPFVILSNGKVHWLWDLQDTHRDAFRIQCLPSRTDLERRRLKHLQPPRPLMSEVIHPGYLEPFKPKTVLRRYQINALDTVSSEFDQQHKRTFLLEMATGTGKTILCAALIRRFIQTRNAERVLFIVDRIELAKQTKEEFDLVLKEYQPVIYKEARRRGEMLGACVVIATIQSLLRDRRYREEFTPFYFDLVVNDEAHRSIYGDAREVVEFFQATRVGLTATPKAYLKDINLAQLQQDNPQAAEARLLRDTYTYFGCKPGSPTFLYDITDAVKDPEGPFLCLPKIIDLRSDITTKALEDSGWTVVINEQEEHFKIRDLERKIFTPGRNRLMCEAFLKHAQKDPTGAMGRSIVFAVNQAHATAITKLLNELQPGIAVTITSRVEDASSIAKDFRDQNRPERIAVSVDMLSTGYNCKDLLNIGLMRPIFSPTEYIQIKGRGTRLFTFKIGNKQYKKEHYFLLDFCAVSEYFQETYDFKVPLPVPRGNKGESGPYPPSSSGTDLIIDGTGGGPGTFDDKPPKEIPTWEGVDIMASEEIRIVGPNGEKVDVMTFRGSFEQDVKAVAVSQPDLQKATDDQDDDAVEKITYEQLYNRPDQYYSLKKLILAYGVPASTAAFVYHALGQKKLPTREAIVSDTVDSIASRFNLRYNEQKWVNATAQLIAEDSSALKRFVSGDRTFFIANQFRTLGGIEALDRFEQRDEVFDALRQSTLVRQTLLAA